MSVTSLPVFSSSTRQNLQPSVLGLQLLDSSGCFTAILIALPDPESES
jgi:hypothetical protein